MKKTADFITKMQQIKIEPCTSTRTGENVKNQYIITAPGCYAFQSYNSLIAVYDIENNILTLGRDFDYSTTTSKYLNQFIEYYCYSIYRELPNGTSVRNRLQKAIDNGIIKYNTDMQ